MRGQWTCNNNVLNDLFRTTVTHGHFDMGYSESTFSKYAFGRGSQKGVCCVVSVYARENDDNYGGPLNTLPHHHNSSFKALYCIMAHMHSQTQNKIM